MSKLDILGLPRECEGVGNVYPVRLFEEDKFYDNYHFLMLGKKHFGIDDDNDIDNIDLLTILFVHYIKNSKDDESIKLEFEKMKVIFSIVLREEMNYIISENGIIFFNEKQNRIINKDNYEKVRHIIMKQNLLFEQKVYKDPLVQKWAMKALEAKQKGNNLTDEAMITTISVLGGKSYDEIKNMTIYQFKAEFYRIMAIKDYDTSVIFATVAGSDGKMPHYTDQTDFDKNPYEGLFKKNNNLFDKLAGSV